MAALERVIERVGGTRPIPIGVCGCASMILNGKANGTGISC